MGPDVSTASGRCPENSSKDRSSTFPADCVSPHNAATYSSRDIREVGSA